MQADYLAVVASHPIPSPSAAKMRTSQAEKRGRCTPREPALGQKLEKVAKQASSLGQSIATKSTNLSQIISSTL
jgi:hypothetical protein